MRTGWLPALLMILLAGCQGGIEESAAGPDGRGQSSSCQRAATTSELLESTSLLVLKGSFKSEAGVDLGNISGIAHADGRLYLLDMALPRIVVLDGELNLLDTFGREGDGPGELATVGRGGPAHHDWIDVWEDSLYVYDSRRLTAFGLDGSAGPTVRGVPAGRLSAMYVSTVTMSPGGPIVLKEIHESLTSRG